MKFSSVYRASNTADFGASATGKATVEACFLGDKVRYCLRSACRVESPALQVLVGVIARMKSTVNLGEAEGFEGEVVGGQRFERWTFRV